MRILVLEHDADAPACLLAQWAHARGHDIDVVVPQSLVAWPEPGDADAIVSLGSEHSARDASQRWIGEEIDFLAAAHSASVPVLAICFGGQALSTALGGTVSRAPRAEVTWRPIESQAPDLITAGPWPFWHEDRFDLPPGARLLAGSETEVVAFADGASVGVQFHPEADAAVVRGWVDGGRDKLRACGVDEAEFEREIKRHGPAARDLAFDLFDRIGAMWSEVRMARQPSLG
ncbi:MAG: type 1 glutamine amidotransferase [Solirubrobacteraceae bacterium]